MIHLNTDDWIVRRWQSRRPAWDSLDDGQEWMPAPPLWKDLTVASGLAVLLWVMAAALIF
jgi:hypothetical protein